MVRHHALFGLVSQVPTSHGAFVGVEHISAQRTHTLALIELAGDLAAAVVLPGQVPGGIDRAREAVERYAFDARRRYAAGVGGYETGGWGRFAHTVLVDMRERLRRSEHPDRVFEVASEAAKGAGRVGRRRVLDSTPLYDAVATMDTVTLIGSALRRLLAAKAAPARTP